MNAISEFFVRNIVTVYFFYGLAFFVMGMALILTGRRTSQFRFALAIVPLAAFGLLHAAHEWFEMFQKIAVQTTNHTVGVEEELFRLALLVLSFLALLAFGLLLLTDHPAPRWYIYAPIACMVLLWLAGVIVILIRFQPEPIEAVELADNLARYSLGIPAALLGAWALMAQQRTFREHDMPQFGRDLVWAAAALLLYGVVGQLFVRETLLAPSHLLSTANFLLWFVIPVQLFRAIMAAGLTFFLLRALRAFDLESQRRLEQANAAKLAVQASALQAERRTSQQMERLNDELRLAAHKLSLLLDLSNLLNTAAPLSDRLSQALERVVQSLPFSEAGLILLAGSSSGQLKGAVATEAAATEVAAATGFASVPDGGASQPPLEGMPDLVQAQMLGQQCIAAGRAICRHRDGGVLEFQLHGFDANHACRQYESPTTTIALPLQTMEQVIGSLVLARAATTEYRLSPAEPALMAGIAQQLGGSIENALLHQAEQDREKVLGELLHQVVGAQEAERQRIARELHDATAQSLTAVGLGLRGVETYLTQLQAGDDPRSLVFQVKELRTFSQSALGELRNIISDLRPSQLDDLGLAAALRWYVQGYEKRRGVGVRLTVDGDDGGLPAEYRAVLFRIAQEALANIAKHAGATAATVKLAIGNEQAQLDICDNGCGFDTGVVAKMEAEQPAGWGLVGMRERALLLGGTFEVESALGQGTRVHVTVPLNVAGSHTINTE